MLLPVCALVAGGLLAWFCHQPAATLVRYLSDDAYYYFKVARHIAAGMGPTFDGVTVTTGFHPLYAFLIVLVDKCFALDQDGLVRAALYLNSFCALSTAALIYISAHRLWGRTAAVWGAVLWLANPNALLLVATGMEGSVYAFCVALFFAVLTGFLREDREGGFYWWRTILLGVAGGACATARTDGLVLVGLAAAYLGFPALASLFSRTRVDFTLFWRSAFSALLFVLLAMAPFIAWILYAHHYTGTWVQASAQMKQLWREAATSGMNGFAVFLFSAEIFFSWVVKSIVKVPMLKYVLPFMAAAAAGVGMMARPRARWIFHLLWLYPLLLGVAYGISFPKTWTWYFAPGLVTLTLMAAGGIAVVVSGTYSRRLTRYATRWFPVLALVAAVECAGYLLSKGARGRNRNQVDMLEVAQWISRNIPDHHRLAAWNSGVYGWYSGRTVINLDGLINNEIFTQVAGRGGAGAYISKRNIDFVVDVEDYMAREVPEWGDKEYEQHYRHASRYMKPIAVWRIKKSADASRPAD